MLLIATKSPFSKPLPCAATNADLILTQDAVIAATQHNDWQFFNAVYVLQSDVEARGLTDHIHDGISVIDITEFVKLTNNHQPIVNW